jgi:hypothetical protein
LHAVAQQAMAAMAVDDVLSFADLRRTMNLLWIEHLKPQADVLAAQAAADPRALTQLKLVLERITALKQAVSLPLEASN